MFVRQPFKLIFMPAKGLILCSTTNAGANQIDIIMGRIISMLSTIATISPALSPTLSCSIEAVSSPSKRKAPKNMIIIGMKAIMTATM